MFSPSSESIESALNFANIFYISVLKVGMPRVFLVFLDYTENKNFKCGEKKEHFSLSVESILETISPLILC